MNWIILFLLACTLVGCGKLQRAQVAERAQSELIGISKLELLSCAGVPVRSEKIEDMEFLTYVGGGDSVGSIAGGAGSSSGGGVISISRRYCEGTFILKNGAVEKVNYTGRTGGLVTKGEQCAYVVEHCLKLK